MENNLTSMASLPPRAHPVMHRRTASDSLVFITDKKHLNVKKEIRDDDFSQEDDDHLDSLIDGDVGDDSNNPSFGDKVILFKAESSTDVVDPDVQRGPNPVVPADQAREMDPKRMKRESAKKSRAKKQEYVEYIKRKIEFDQMKVDIKARQVAYNRNDYSQLVMENIELKKKMATLEFLKASKDAEYKVLVEIRDKILREEERMSANLNHPMKPTGLSRSIGLSDLGFLIVNMMMKLSSFVK
ncbi:hypothetical protein EZV62_016690 [Acer yangbiense]|uniref:BZIP domain-containing protein n=1 Tax=Acer yangbiense TaxID=1000413 RepID=A0A5C7HPC7_9ROSI|nr:hypothetical protein EZV62_016690 [Acer yangbiense]